MNDLLALKAIVFKQYEATESALHLSAMEKRAALAAFCIVLSEIDTLTQANKQHLDD